MEAIKTYYNMVDRPAIRFPKERMRDAHYTNKPRREFHDLQKAITEAQRLCKRTNARVLTLEVVAITAPTLTVEVT